MRFSQKVILLLIFPFALEMLIGCCPCHPSIESDYSNCSLEVLPLDNAGDLPAVVSSDSIKKEAFGLQLVLSRMEMECAYATQYLFINSASAITCDCPPTVIYEPLELIESCQIITLSNFNDYPAGSDIGHLFYHYGFDEYQPFTSWLYDQTNEIVEYRQKSARVGNYLRRSVDGSSERSRNVSV